jgi:Tol biopolymer transport system component
MNQSPKQLWRPLKRLAGGVLFLSVAWAGLAAQSQREDEPQQPEALAPRAKIAFASYRDGNFEIYSMDADGSNLSRLTENAGEDTNPAWSPDGSRLAFVSSRDGNPEIYTMNADGTNQTRLTDNAASDLTPVWSPDGLTLIFVSNRTGNDDIFRVNGDGTGLINLTNDAGDDFSPSFSPDGQFIAFASNRDGIQFEIYRMDAAGFNLLRLTNNDRNDINPSVSAGRITFQSDRNDNDEIFSMNPDGSNQISVTNDLGLDGDPSRSSDGSRIAFATSRDGNFEIYAANADGSGLARLTNDADNDIQPAFQPTGLLPPTPGPNTPAVQLSAAAYTVAENGVTATITVTRSGPANGAATVDYATLNSTATDVGDYTPNFGTLIFAAGETSKTFTVSVINDANIEADEKLTVTLSKGVNTAIGSPASASLTITDNDSVAAPNPIDDTQAFVRQQYLDFLSREPDAAGFAFWVERINSCGADLNCVAQRRIDVSAAFFIEDEFQASGYFVNRLYRGALGRLPRYREFIQDRARVVGGAQLETSRTAFAADFVERDEFTTRYPLSMTNTQFVNTLFDSAGLTPFTAERQAQITALNNGATRAQVVRNLIELQAFRTREFNPAFVLMQYFGYLRRDFDPAGYAFWLDVVNNRDPNNYRGMVGAFVNSAEYRVRFGQQ